ncbi:MAG: UDP-N-acetylmuramate dehydrogenase [Ignavibacteriaceae bacterium]
MKKIEKNISLKNLNTFGVDLKSKYFVEVYSEEELKQVLNKEEYSSHQKLILGGGSNILFTKDFDGLVIKNSITGIKLFDEDNNNVIVEAGAGVIWEELVQYCVDRNYSGIENLSYIPGTVGAAPIQNIGAYGQELEETFYELNGIYIDSCETKKFNKSECGFSYRNSIFKNELKNKFVITSVRLRLNKNPDVNLSYNPVQEEVEKRDIKKPTIKDIRDIVIDIRKSKLPDPNELGNAGSFYKNPVITKEKFKILKEEYPDINYFVVDDDNLKIPAAWLVEKCGWKGKRIGNVGAHKIQPLVIVNFGNASGKEIYELSKMIKNDVKKTFDLTLENEVNIL